jgi:hypothetical protein
MHGAKIKVKKNNNNKKLYKWMFIMIDAPMDMFNVKIKWTFLSSYSRQY